MPTPPGSPRAEENPFNDMDTTLFDGPSPSVDAQEDGEVEPEPSDVDETEALGNEEGSAEKISAPIGREESGEADFETMPIPKNPGNAEHEAMPIAGPAPSHEDLSDILVPFSLPSPGGGVNTAVEDLGKIESNFQAFQKDSWRKVKVDVGAMAGYWLLFNAENIGLSYLVELLNVASKTNENWIVPAFVIWTAIQYLPYELVEQHFLALKEDRISFKDFMLNVGLPLPMAVAAFTQVARWWLTSCLGSDVETAVVVTAAYTPLALLIPAMIAQQEKKEAEKGRSPDERSVLMEDGLKSKPLTQKEVAQRTSVPLTQAWIAVGSLVALGATECSTGVITTAVNAIMDAVGINSEAANLVISSSTLLGTYGVMKLTGVQVPLAKGFFKAGEAAVKGTKEAGGLLKRCFGK